VTTTQARFRAAASRLAGGAQAHAATPTADPHVLAFAAVVAARHRRRMLSAQAAKSWASGDRRQQSWRHRIRHGDGWPTPADVYKILFSASTMADGAGALWQAGRLRSVNGFEARLCRERAADPGGAADGAKSIAAHASCSQETAIPTRPPGNARHDPSRCDLFVESWASRPAVPYRGSPPAWST